MEFCSKLKDKMEPCHLWQHVCPSKHHAKQNKTDSESQILLHLIYMWHLKLVKQLNRKNRMVVATGTWREEGDIGQRLQSLSYAYQFQGFSVQHGDCS